jgi:hypothetical protein
MFDREKSMATKLENLKIELAHHNNLEPYLLKFQSTQYPGFKMCKKTKQYQQFKLFNGHIQVSSEFETVMAYLCCTNVVSLNDKDLGNGADCKLTTVRHSSHHTTYSAPVGDIFYKKGTLYVSCYERIQNKFYYFAIPRFAYCTIPKSSNIEIPFELDGTPRRIPAGKRTYANWWEYECTSLVDMSTFCGTTGMRIPHNRINGAIIAANAPPTWAHLFVGM